MYPLCSQKIANGKHTVFNELKMSQFNEEGHLMMNETKITTADPSPVGLLGLALITLIASSVKLGWTEGVTFVIPWAIFLGASAQLYAGIKDAQKNNIFGATAFLGYAFFWYSVAFVWLGQSGVFGEGMMVGDGKQLGFAYLGYLIFTAYMTFGSLRTNKVLFIIFSLIDVLFLGLTLSAFGVSPHVTHLMAGWAEFGIAMVAFYGSAATVLNGQAGKTVLPVGKPFMK